MITHAPTINQLPVEHFSSKDGHDIRLGHFKNRQLNKAAVYQHTFQVHDVTNDPSKHTNSFIEENKGGLNKTRFGKGFQRKNVQDISNPIKDIHQEHKNDVQSKSASLSKERHSFLKSIDNYNGYDIITGNSRQGPGGMARSRKEGVRYLGDGLGPEAPHRANLLLRDSSNRFFTPQYSGPNHEIRQNVLVKNGCFAERFSSMIKHGAKDIPSAGLEDQFSKSNYHEKTNSACHGLSEKTEAGRYTPRKQLGNPSGDPGTVSNWGKGVDLNHQASSTRISNSNASSSYPYF